jgi:hypothetical protein
MGTASSCPHFLSHYNQFQSLKVLSDRTNYPGSVCFFLGSFRGNLGGYKWCQDHSHSLTDFLNQEANKLFLLNQQKTRTKNRRIHKLNLSLCEAKEKKTSNDFHKKKNYHTHTHTKPEVENSL